MSAFDNAQYLYDNMEDPRYSEEWDMGDVKCAGCDEWIMTGVDESVTVNGDTYCIECAESWDAEDWR